MEVVNNSFLPGDPRLIDHIVYELKSQGIFDNFRKECIADVDTKPAYQNLRQRVEGSVSGFLKTQKWRSDMNKNHVREMLRKNISESGFLETGVERIVDQVVNPKINTIFLPQVENVVYKVLGIQKPTAFDDLKKEESVEVKLDLLPNDLEAVSPESEPLEKKLDTSNESQKLDDKVDEDDSPPFEPLEPNTQHEENSVDSNLSGISGLVSHDSNHSVENKPAPLEILNPDSQLSKQSSDDRLSIVMFEEQDTKMETNDDSNISKVSTCKIIDTNSKSVDVPDSQSSEIVEITSSTEKTEEIKKVEEKRSSEKKSEKHHSSHKHSSHKSKHDSKDRKSDKDKKSDNKDRKDHRSHKSSESSEKKDKDKKKDEKHGDSKGTKDSKSEKSRERTSSGHRHSKDKSSKRDSRETKNKESVDNKEGKSKTTSESKDSKAKESKDRSKEGSKSRSHSSTKKSSKDDTKSYSKHNGKSKTDSSDSSKMSSKDSKKSDKSHKKDDKHSSHTSDRKSDKRDKDKKDSRKEVKKETKDDHYSLKEKKTHRRSTDRDSSDGQSGNHSSSSSFADLNSSQLQKSSQESSIIDSGATSGGDSGNSDAIIGFLSKTTDISSIPCIVSEEENARVLSNKVPHLKLIKPKFASNIFEARKLMKIRKKLSKLEKQKQMELISTNTLLNESSIPSSHNHKVSNESVVTSDKVETTRSRNKKHNTSKTRKAKDSRKIVKKLMDDNEVEVVQPPNDEEPLQTSVISKESWDAIEAKLNAQNIVDYNSYTDTSESIEEVSNKKNFDREVKKKDDNIREVEQKDNYDNFKGFNTGLINNAEKCLQLSHKVISDWESDLAKLSKAYLVSLAEKDKSRLERNNEEFNELNRLPKIEIVDVTSNNEIIFSPGRGIKRIANDHTDMHNNNKINKELDLLNERLNDVTDSHEQSAIPLHKSKKQKLIDTSVNSLENFNLPLSPADSDKSYNSVNEKKNEVAEGRPRRNRAISNQRYSSDDLYKPRMQFSSRRRTTNNEKN